MAIKFKKMTRNEYIHAAYAINSQLAHHINTTVRVLVVGNNGSGASIEGTLRIGYFANTPFPMYIVCASQNCSAQFWPEAVTNIETINGKLWISVQPGKPCWQYHDWTKEV